MINLTSSGPLAVRALWRSAGNIICGTSRSEAKMEREKRKGGGKVGLAMLHVFRPNLFYKSSERFVEKFRFRFFHIVSWKNSF